MRFEEIDQLVRQANPVPDPSELGSRPTADEIDARHERDDQRRAAMQIQDLSSTREVSSTTEIQRRADPGFPRGWTAVAAAALVIVVALVSFSAGTGGDDGTDGADAAAAPTVSPAALADSFVARLAEYDAPGAVSYLTGDALVDAGGMEGLASDLRWREATGFQSFFDPCQETGGDRESTIVRCPYRYHGVRSAEQGLEPYEGSSYRIIVRSGWIVGFADRPEFNENGFDADVWQPFHQWLLANHPDDVALMYADQTASSPNTTDESIGLWERRSREYLDGPDPTDPP